MKRPSTELEKILVNDVTDEINFQNIPTAHIAQYQKNQQSNEKMSRRSKYTSLQRRHTEDEEAHEKVLNITNYSRNANENYNEVLPHTASMVIIQKCTNNKGWRGCGEKGTFLHCWWGCNLV